jgi:hypothetical protein
MGADVIFPPDELAGLNLGEAFRRCVLEDPEVKERGRTLPTRSDVFRDGRYPTPVGIIYLWPPNLEAAQLASDFNNPGLFFADEGRSPPSNAVLNAAEAIASQWKALCALLASGQLIGEGTFVSTGLHQAIHGEQWSRRSMLIDVRNSDLLEGPRHLPILRWSGIVLCLPQVPRDVGTSPKPAVQRVVTTAASRLACKKWLVEQMRADPHARGAAKRNWLDVARRKWPGSLSERAFDGAWAEAVVEAEAPAWAAAGAPKKSLRDNHRAD